MRVGLVLGAGGIQGGAWLTGGLDALATETGWDPGEAEVIVGTSAGSMIGALCASGIPPWFMVAHSSGETFNGIVDAFGSEARKLRERGTDAVLVQPTTEDLKAIGPNLMSRDNRQATTEVARRTVAEQLRRPSNRAVLEGLPPGRPEKVGRPDTPPDQWPDLLELSGGSAA